ncbi:GAF and ANTAR domain-containing protein [Streptomyces sp. NPDC048304]|uniref:GAF and ANTAR domain-containing protein n=1 Tax=Streptomyces sp. NPDC048304 TaxID=3154820 RepID=UPI0033D2FA77
MDWERFAERLAVLARELLEQDSVQATLDRIASAAVEIVDGCEAAGVLTLRKRAAVTLAACGDLAAESDRLQGRFREGPCFDVAHRSDAARAYRIMDLSRPQPAWPKYAPAARRLGVGSVMGFLLYARGEDFGALNLYSRRPGAFTEASETAGWVLASHCAVALASASTEEQLGHALETRHAIGEAMGILMERHRLSEDDAFDVLRRVSQHHNVKLRDVAQRVRRGPLIPPER